MNEEWATLSDAAFQLRTEGINVSVSKLSRMASKGEIKTANDPTDQRVRLVDLNELRQMFASPRRRR
jgi:hypothetical protein